MKEYLSGLSFREVTERRECGEGGNADVRITKKQRQDHLRKYIYLVSFFEFSDRRTSLCSWRLFQYAVYRHYYVEYYHRDITGTESKKAGG